MSQQQTHRNQDSIPEVFLKFKPALGTVGCSKGTTIAEFTCKWAFALPAINGLRKDICKISLSTEPFFLQEPEALGPRLSTAEVHF